MLAREGVASERADSAHGGERRFRSRDGRAGAVRLKNCAWAGAPLGLCVGSILTAVRFGVEVSPVLTVSACVSATVIGILSLVLGHRENMQMIRLELISDTADQGWTVEDVLRVVGPEPLSDPPVPVPRAVKSRRLRVARSLDRGRRRRIPAQRTARQRRQPS